MRHLLWSLVLMIAAQVSFAQEADPAYLVADSILYHPDGQLIAEGNVEIIQGDTRLRATRVTYDRDADRIVIQGPLRINEADGWLVLADGAQLDADFQNGLLQGARILLDGQLQLAAADAQRSEGRLTQMRQVVATSCQVCGSDTPPVWQIRARRVLHDEEARQLYFEDAQLRIWDLPVVYLPRMRLPDPTLKRARGFLIPELQSSTLLGLGIKVPYFIPIGERADLTLEPYVSTVTRTLDLRFRRAFARGDLQIDGAISRDKLETGLRGYLFTNGDFSLANGTQIRFDTESTTDRSYLSDYDYSTKDRLDSALLVSRVQQNSYAAAEITHFESLRETESNATQPTVVARLDREQRFDTPWSRTGQMHLAASMHGLLRTSDVDVDGRDLWRAHAEARYLDGWTLPLGLRLSTELGFAADQITTRQDSTTDARVTQISPQAGVTLRWPLMRAGQGQAVHLLEPVAQLGWVGGNRTDHVSDETAIQEFDEGNLLDLSRFPADDRLERGGQATAGLRWRRDDPTGWSSAVTLARLWRDQPDDAFSEASGLAGDSSDWLLATQFQGANGLQLDARGLFGGSSRANSAQARAGWDADRFGLDATYVLEIADPAENRPTAQSEWNVSGHYDVTTNWTASTNWRYDLAADNLARAGLRLDYRNECVDVGLSVSRRFASSANVEPSTKFGLTVTLKGFSTGGAATPETRTCS